jgi:hypothetical protein
MIYETRRFMVLESVSNTPQGGRMRMNSVILLEVVPNEREPLSLLEL